MANNLKEAVNQFLQFASSLIKQCGEIALKYYGKGDPAVKFDDNLVTEAELAVQNYAEGSINNRFPKHQIYGEDKLPTSYQHGSSGYFWVFDPIDGTASFQAGIPVWGISMALLRNFWPILGVFYMPVTKEIYTAIEGESAYHNESQMQIERTSAIDNESLLLTYSRFHGDFRSTFPGKIRNLGSAAAHIAYVASGRAEAAIIRNVAFKDLAAAQIILKSAGGEIVFLDGKPLHLNDYLDGQKIEEPLFAIPKGELKYLRAYITSI